MTTDPEALGRILANLAHQRILAGMTGSETGMLFAGEVSEGA
jgi:hypothetical protein